MKLPLAYYGNPILRKKSAKVEVIDEELRQFVNDMIESMFAYDGMGLAAVQVLRPISLFITNIPKRKPDTEDEWEPGKIKVYINAQLSNPSEEKTINSEGCLSIPGLHGDVIRPHRITVEATNIEGERFTEELSGLEARCVMHENDHTNGILYVDRMLGKERQMIEKHLRDLKKKYKI